MTEIEIKRFWDKVELIPFHSCWEWVASKDRYGYGRFGKGCKLAHRVSYKLHYGPFDEKLCVCHSCDNRGCVNPYHLFLGSTKENQTDKLNKNRQSKKETHGKSKLSEKEVLEIRSKYVGTKGQQTRLAEEYNISHDQIYKIVNGREWKI